MPSRLGKIGLYALGFLSMFVLWHVSAVYLVDSILFPPILVYVYVTLFHLL